MILGVLIVTFVTHWKQIHDQESKRSCFVDLGPLGGTSQLPRVRRNCRWVSYRCQAQEGFQRHNGWNKTSSKIIPKSHQNHINIDNIVLFHLISLGSGLIYPARCNQDSSERGARADPDISWHLLTSPDSWHLRKNIGEGSDRKNNFYIWQCVKTLYP